MAPPPDKMTRKDTQETSNADEIDLTLSLRLAAASARTSPLLFRVVSPLLSPTHRLERFLHSFILVDLLHALKIPRAVSSAAIASTAAFQLHRAYLKQPKAILSAFALVSPLQQALEVIDALGSQGEIHGKDVAGLLSWWLIYGSLSVTEAVRVRPLSQELTATPATSALGVVVSRLRETLSSRAPRLAQYIPDINVRPAATSQIAYHKPKVSLLKRTFGPRWPLLKLIILLLLQHSGGRPALAVVRWLVQPIHYLLSILFRSDSSDHQRKILKVVYTDETQPVPEVECTPRVSRVSHKLGQNISRASSVERDQDWTRASTMLDSGILTSEVWNSPSKKPPRS